MRAAGLGLARRGQPPPPGRGPRPAPNGDGRQLNKQGRRRGLRAPPMARFSGKCLLFLCEQRWADIRRLNREKSFLSPDRGGGGRRRRGDL